MSFMLISSSLVGQTSCNDPDSPAGFRILETGPNCCIVFEPCRIPVNQINYTWTFSNGVVVTSTSGRVHSDAAITQCFCEAGVYSVTLQAKLPGGSVYTTSDTFVIDDSCQSDITADFTTEIIDYSNCSSSSGPSGCGDCESVTVKLIDISVSNKPIVSWFWSITVIDNIGDPVYSQTSSAQNPEFTLEEVWFAGYKVFVRQVVTDDCGISDNEYRLIKGSC